MEYLFVLDSIIAASIMWNTNKNWADANAPMRRHVSITPVRFSAGIVSSKEEQHRAADATVPRPVENRLYLGDLETNRNVRPIDHTFLGHLEEHSDGYFSCWQPKC